MGVSAAKRLLLLMLLLLFLLLLPSSARSRAGLADRPASGASLGAAGTAPTGAKCEAGVWGPWGIIGTEEEGWLLLEKRERGVRTQKVSIGVSKQLRLVHMLLDTCTDWCTCFSILA